MKENQAKNKMADPLEGQYAFIRSNRAGVTDSGVALVRSQGAPPVLVLQDYDLTVRQPTATPPYALTPAIRTRIYCTMPTAAETWDMIDNHVQALVAVRDLSHGRPPNARVSLDGTDYWLRAFNTHGVASLVVYSDPAPFQLPAPIVKSPKELGTLALWVAMVPPVGAPVAFQAPAPLAITVRSDTYLDVDGKIKGKGTYLNGSPVDKTNEWLVFAAEMAGTTNLPSDLHPKNLLVLLDPGFYPALYASAASASACTDHITQRFEALFSVDLALEHTSSAHPVVQSTLTHLKALYHMMGTVVRNGGPKDELKGVVEALRAILGPRLRSKKWRTSLISEPACVSPPWFFREEKQRLAREALAKAEKALAEKIKKGTPSSSESPVSKKRGHEEEDDYE